MWPGEWFDVQLEFAVLKHPHGAGRLTDAEGNGLAVQADACGSKVPAAQAFAQADAVGGNVEVQTSGFGNAIAADQDGPIELGDLSPRDADEVPDGVVAALRKSLSKS